MGLALLLVTSGQIISGTFLVILCFSLHVPAPASHYSVLAAIGGFEGALSLVIFYRALAIGAMGLTAALTGLLTALIPVLYSLLREGLPAPVNIAGLVTGCAAIWLITQQAPAAPANRQPGQAETLSFSARSQASASGANWFCSKWPQPAEYCGHSHGRASPAWEHSCSHLPFCGRRRR